MRELVKIAKQTEAPKLNDKLLNSVDLHIVFFFPDSTLVGTDSLYSNL